MSRWAIHRRRHSGNSQVQPGGAVPSLVLDGGETLVDSSAIIDHLLEVGDPEHRLLPASGTE